jgi:hypothetical protein
LTLETLDLVWNETLKYYEAPYQMKANGGMLLIDDFGRQQVRPRDLLNRWIVPLEKRLDYLALHTGRKIEIPFDVLIVFSTNLAPRDLVDEAFLRRIRHKVEIGDPNFEEYGEIFKRVAKAKGMQYDDRALGYLLQGGISSAQMRAVTDLIDQLVDIALQNTQPVLSKDPDRPCLRAYLSKSGRCARSRSGATPVPLCLRGSCRAMNAFLAERDHPLNLAHRGASAYAPENTLAAFRLAAEMGADGLEIDAKLSRDGAIVIMHDATVDRTTSGSGRVSDLTLGQSLALGRILFEIRRRACPNPRRGHRG